MQYRVSCSFRSVHELLTAQGVRVLLPARGDQTVLSHRFLNNIIRTFLSLRNCVCLFQFLPVSGDIYAMVLGI